MGPESQLVEKIRGALLMEYPGSVLWKIHGSPMQVAGIPDLVGCVRGRFIGFEVKLPGDPHPVSKRQASMLRRINRAGGIGAAIHSPQEALELLSALPRGSHV